MLLTNNTGVVVVTTIFLINLPFGYWRAGVRRFSFPWFLAVHIPVPLTIVLRMLVGLGWRLGTLPVFMGAFFMGQFLGGLLHKVQKR